MPCESAAHEEHPASSIETTQAVREVLEGRRAGLSILFPFIGPAVVVSVAYMDPGNFATNIQAGARYGYSLLWVVASASAVAMLFQGLSAKLGIVTGKNLAELCREHFPPPLVFIMWAISEVAAIATDLAEIMGGSVGLSLLLNISLFASVSITAVLTYSLLYFQKAGYRPLELAIGALVGVIGLSYLAELFLTPVAWTSIARDLVNPRLPDKEALTLAVGIVGATVMPHALFLHSGLTQARMSPRNDAERTKLVRFSNLEVVVALSIAGLINMAMVIMSAGAFHSGHPDVAEIESAYHSLTPLLGVAAAGIFLISLIASGISSSVVGTMAGQMIMQGFVSFKTPLWLRRTITIVPSFVIVACGINVTTALVTSQVVLSLALPFPMLALVWFASRLDVIGAYRMNVLLRIGASVCTVAVLGLNLLLVYQTFWN